MGYFSRKALEIEERKIYCTHPSYPSAENLLCFHLTELMDKLEMLDEARPHDLLDPLFDRYFYEDHIAHYYEEPNTVQGILRAISEVKVLINTREQAMHEHERFMSAIQTTGADPDGQIVFAGIFLPLQKYAASA